MGDTSDRLLITIHAAEVTPEEAERLSDTLREELLLLQVRSVDRISAEAAPPGAKGGAAQMWGTLLVSGVFSAAMVRAVAQVAAAWLSRSAARSVSIEQDGRTLTIQGASTADVDTLVQKWIQGLPDERDAPTRPADS